MNKYAADLTKLARTEVAGFAGCVMVSALGLICVGPASARDTAPVTARSARETNAGLHTSTLLICSNTSSKVSLTLGADRNYNIKYAIGSRSIELDGLISAQEYTSVNNQEPSLFIQWQRANRPVQIYLDTVITGESARNTTVSLRVNGHALEPIHCSIVLKTPSIRLHGRTTGLPFINIWQLGYEKIAQNVSDYDEQKFGTWL